uniref:Peptidase S74 domain-containing protein n=1 Tax=viral metagenome TaxID=1070528 RepID=A0A6C0DC38_9ZZZZ
MSTYIVNPSTSVVLLDTSVLTTGQSAIVLLSSSTIPGRNITIRDSAGYLSTPQTIIVSTMNGIRFLDGTSSIETSQANTSLTFTSHDPQTWMIVNTFGFPLYTTIANVNTLHASTISGTTIRNLGLISTSGIVGRFLDVNSTSRIHGTAFISTLVIGNPSQYETLPGYSLYVEGSSRITSNVNITGNLSVGGGSQLQSSMMISSSLSVGESASIGGNIYAEGSIVSVGAGTFRCESANIRSTLAVVGQATFGSNVFIASNLQVQGSITAATTTSASTIQINTTAGGYLQLGSGPILSLQSGAASWNSPIYTPFLSTQQLLNSGYSHVNVLEVYSTISAPTLTQFLLGSTNIQNPNGSLIINSINANTFTLSNALTIPSIQSSNIRASTITIQGNLTLTSPIGYVSATTMYTSSVYTTTLSTARLIADSFQTPLISVSTLAVGETIEGGPTFNTFSIPSTTIVNSQGIITTRNLYTSLCSTSSITFQGGGTITSPSTISIQTPNMFISSVVNMSSISTTSLEASTITTSRITIGTPITNTLPEFRIDTRANISISGGPGNYLTPYILSNVRPSNDPYTTYALFTANYFSQTPPPGLVVGYTATLFWGNNFDATLGITGGQTLYGTFGSDQTITGTIQTNTFEISAALGGNSAISVTFGFQNSPNFTSIDSNAVIEFNNGILHWNYALNGTTIQNSLNDISTRNLFYYGSLNFASDPRVKEDIEEANLEECFETISNLPLCKYKYIDEYCTKFNVPNTTRLGFLATDVLPHFPKSVHVSDTIFPEFSTSLLTIETSQIEMAHIGATKYLLREIERLENLIRGTE